MDAPCVSINRATLCRLGPLDVVDLASLVMMEEVCGVMDTVRRSTPTTRRQASHKPTRCKEAHLNSHSTHPHRNDLISIELKN